MADMLSPGVYTVEHDDSAYVSDSSTCIVGIVGEAKSGPVGVPTLVTSQKDLINLFGTPTEGEYGIYSALEILTQASQLYYVRAVRSATKASAGVAGTDKILYTAKNSGTEYNGITIKQTLTSSAPDIGEGEVDFETGETISDGSSAEVIKSIEVLDAEGEVLERFESTGELDNVFEKEANSSFDYIQILVMPNGEFTNKELTLKGAVDSGSYAVAGDPEVDKITFRSKYIDSSINGGSVTISDPDVYGYFNVYLEDSKGSELEAWTAVTLDIDDERYIGGIINKSSKRIVCEINDSVEGVVTGNTLKFVGGDDGVDGITSADIIGEADGVGIHALDNPELLSIDVMLVPGRTEPEVIQAALRVCEQRGDCIFVADTPFGLSASEVTNWTNGEGNFIDHQAFNSSFGAFYWPWVSYSDPYTKKNIWLPPSGFVVSRYAYNDRVSNPWNAPAGLSRGRITDALGVEKSPTKGERDLVYGNRNIVNPIANFQSEGLVVWGQKTMQRKPTALDRVNVRRLVNYLKRTVGNAVRRYIFEANNSSTWTDLKTVVNPILAGVKNSGGVYEYKITIHPTGDDIENNRMPLNVYIKPTKTAEFIPITFNLLAYGASFSDAK